MKAYRQRHQMNPPKIIEVILAASNDSSISSRHFLWVEKENEPIMINILVFILLCVYNRVFSLQPKRQRPLEMSSRFSWPCSWSFQFFSLFVGIQTLSSEVLALLSSSCSIFLNYPSATELLCISTASSSTSSCISSVLPWNPSNNN